MKRPLLFALFLLLPFLAYAEWDQFFPTDDDPSLFHHVNVISGHLSLCMQDTLVRGAKPFPLLRTYTSAGALERTPQNTDLVLKRYRQGGWLVQGGWNFLPHANIFAELDRDRKKHKFYVAEPSGSIHVYTCCGQDGKDIFYYSPKEIAAHGSGNLSGRTNPKNNLLCVYLKEGRAVLYLPDGGTRTYTGPVLHKVDLKRIPRCYYHLKEESLPSKHQIIYFYHGDRLVDMALMNPSRLKTYSWVHLNLLSDAPFRLQAVSSDGKCLEYAAMQHEKREYIAHIASNCRPEERHGYSAGRKGIGARMEEMTLGGRSQFRVSYYVPSDKKTAQTWLDHPDTKGISADKVEHLYAPVGTNGEMLSIGHFGYQPSYTDVRDVEGILTRFHHNGEKLLGIEYFNESDALASYLHHGWNGNQLTAKVMFDGNRQPLFSKTFAYDASGNVIEEVFYGNLSGMAQGPFTMQHDGSLAGAECCRKTYQYLPKFNLPIVESEGNGLAYKYHYIPDTDLLQAKCTCINDRVFKREIYYYDNDHLLVAQVEDDGSSGDISDLTDVTRHLVKRYDIHPETGLPIAVKEWYFDVATVKEIQIRRAEYTYNAQHLMISEKVYDANDIYRYTLTTDYDAQGRVIYKTNPLGQASTYRYDVHGNLLESQEAGGKHKSYTYDAAGRPLSCTETDFLGVTRTTSDRYDSKGRLLAQTDSYGNVTDQVYDAFGRCRATSFSWTLDESGNRYRPQLQFNYDSIGNLISTTTLKGETTSTSYTAFRKPIRTYYPDGCETLNVYYTDGTLAKTVYPDLTEEHYAYDVFQRLISKKIFSRQQELLSEESWVYNTFSLLSHTDERGLVTIYGYDGAGRKISEDVGGRVTTYAYDALGYLYKTSSMGVSKITRCDEGGRVVECWEEDEATGAIENRMFFSYNGQNKKEKAIRITDQGEAIDLFAYDGEGRLIRHTDPLGGVTEFCYAETSDCFGQRVLQKKTIDALGNQVIETYDALEKLISTVKNDPQGEIVSQEELFYDRSGNKAKRISTVFSDHQSLKTITVSWEYDARGKVTQEIEADQKITCFRYDTKGRLIEKTLPSGIAFAYTYDGLNRLLEQKSSDKTVHYSYVYDKGPDPILIKDHLTHDLLKRSYNLFGQLLFEINPCGMELSWKYDHYGRVCAFYLYDGSSVQYDYQGRHLQAVKRIGADGALRYIHTYAHFDANGHATEEQLIHELGHLHTARDLLERETLQTSAWLTHTTTYGPSGLVMQSTNTLFGDKDYAYDALNQLTREGKIAYQFDSLGNPTEYEVNARNQLLATKDTQLAYDPDGNPIERSQGNEQVFYQYDALGRLTTITYPKERQVHYYYDAFSRLIFKADNPWKNNTWKEGAYRFYIYDQDCEVGLCTASGKLIQFKSLGLGLKGDIGATVAIELQGKVYAPLHDFRGNIIALLSQEGKLVETYDLDAFGREKTFPSKPLNPWRFCSKRTDEKLVYFGLRFYDPALQRWLTPDPSGFSDGPNLYAYVQNNPLNRLDLFGLYSLPFQEQFINISMPIPIIQIPAVIGTLCLEGTVIGAKRDFVVSCGHWHKLQFTPEELSAGKVNIIDHFYDLCPKTGALVGITTYINGMNTTLDEFHENCGTIIKNLPTGHLFVGYYNNDIGGLLGVDDTTRAILGEVTPSIYLAAHFMGGMADTIKKVNPEMYWLHVAHSQGGLLTVMGIENTYPRHKEIFKRQLLNFGLGPAAAMPKSYVAYTQDIFSKMDHVTLRFSKHLIDNPDYNIKIVKCITPKSERQLGWIDHAFLGRTYQHRLEKTINKYKQMEMYYENSF